MKITFEGKTIDEILDANGRHARSVLTPNSSGEPQRLLRTRVNCIPYQRPLSPVDKPVDKPVHEQSVESPRTAKQLENDARLRARALEKQAKKKAAKPAPAPEAKIVEKKPDDLFREVDPAEMVNIRQKTIQDLQAAYANGHQEEVFELLSRFGDGAKSFRELPPEAFGPIREAIDLGALEGEAPK